MLDALLKGGFPVALVFEDETVLEPVKEEEAKRLQLEVEEQEDPDGDITVIYSLSPPMLESIQSWIEYADMGYVDYVFCHPLVIRAMEIAEMTIEDTPFRAPKFIKGSSSIISVDKRIVSP